MLTKCKNMVSFNFDKIYVTDKSWSGLFRSVTFVFIGKYLVVLLASETMPCAIMTTYMFAPIFIKCMWSKDLGVCVFSFISN